MQQSAAFSRFNKAGKFIAVEARKENIPLV
jgi:hypothetical protein